jgi:3-oxoacyl-[acyl-carrier protein] reductase
MGTVPESCNFGLMLATADRKRHTFEEHIDSEFRHLASSHPNKKRTVTRMIDIDLTGKTAIVTGSSQGLGLATVTCLHRAGANVIVNFFPDPQGNQATLAARLVASLGQRAIAIGADIRRESDVELLVGGALEGFGGLDILVNNAGVLRDKTMKKMQIEEWQEVIDTNLTGVFRTCKRASAVMNNGGRIVNLASISALVGFFGQANYAASKAGVIGLTKVISRELASRQITVNAVAPGVVLTEMGKSIPEASREQMIAQIPLGRFGSPEDIANAILFLCSPLADYITGQTLHVNGGWVG